jgi:hypothetical protein
MPGNITEFTTEKAKTLNEEETERLRLLKKEKERKKPSGPCTTWMDLEFSKE